MKWFLRELSMILLAAALLTAISLYLIPARACGDGAYDPPAVPDVKVVVG